MPISCSFCWIGNWGSALVDCQIRALAAFGFSLFASWWPMIASEMATAYCQPTDTLRAWHSCKSIGRSMRRRCFHERGIQLDRCSFLWKFKKIEWLDSSTFHRQWHRRSYLIKMPFSSSGFTTWIVTFVTRIFCVWETVPSSTSYTSPLRAICRADFDVRFSNCFDEPFSGANCENKSI